MDESVRREAVQVDTHPEGDVPGGESFPHVYGPISRDAVLRAVPVPLTEDGRLDVPAAMGVAD